MGAVNKPVEEVSQGDDDKGRMLEAICMVQGVVEFDMDGTILSASDKFLSPLGYQLEDLAGQNHLILCDPQDADSESYQDFWAGLAMGQPVVSDVKRVGKDGSDVWLHAVYTPVMDADGTPHKIVALTHDITAQKRAELVNLRKVTGYENSSSAMMAVDRDFIVTDINQSTVELMERSADVFAKVWPNFKPDEIIGSCIDQFHKSPAHQRAMLADPANLPWKTDITIGEFKFALNVGGIFDDDGTYIGNLLEWDDVTDARMNAGILEALDRSTPIIEFTPDGKITDANDNFLSAMGYSHEEIKGRHHRMFCDPGYVETDAYKEMWDALAQGESLNGDFERIKKDGSSIWIRATYNAIVDGNGTVFKVVKFASDVTEQIELGRTAERLSLVANETDNSVVITDAAGRIEYVNPGFVKLTGYQSDECIGKTPGELLQGNLTDPETVKRIGKKLEKQEPFMEEIVNYNKEGTPYWISLVVMRSA